MSKDNNRSTGIVIFLAAAALLVWGLWDKPISEIVAGGIVGGVVVAFVMWRRKKTGASAESQNKNISVLLFTFVTVFAAQNAFAWTAPVAGQMGYSFYDFLINQGLKGPMGTTAGVGSVIYGATGFLGPQFMKVVGGFATGIGLLKGEEIAIEMGKLFF